MIICQNTLKPQINIGREPEKFVGREVKKRGWVKILKNLKNLTVFQLSHVEFKTLIHQHVKQCLRVPIDFKLQHGDQIKFCL